MSALLAALLVAIPAPGAGAAGPESICLLPEEERPPLTEPVELCGLTTLSGSSSGAVRVNVPVQARLTLSVSGVVNFGPGKENDLTGDGRVVGFAIMEDRPARDGRGVAFARLPVEFDVFGRYAWHGFNGVGPAPASFTLMPGDHLLYLLADGSPVTVTLRFEGLEGHVEAGPARAAAFDIRGPMEPIAPCLQACPYYSAGATGTLTSKGIGFMSFARRDASAVAGAYGLCNYNGDPGAPQAAYAPGCPVVTQSDLLMVVPVLGFGFPLYYRVDELWGPLEAGTYGMGAWAALAGLTDSVATLAFFLSFD